MKNILTVLFFKIISFLIAIVCMYIVSRVLYYTSNFSFTWHTPGRMSSQTHNLSFSEIKSDKFCNNSWRRINTKYISLMTARHYNMCTAVIFHEYMIFNVGRAVMTFIFVFRLNDIILSTNAQ